MFYFYSSLVLDLGCEVFGLLIDFHSRYTEEAALRRVGQGQALQRPEGPGYLHPEGQ